MPLVHVIGDYDEEWVSWVRGSTCSRGDEVRSQGLQLIAILSSSQRQPVSDFLYPIISNIGDMQEVEMDKTKELRGLC